MLPPFSANWHCRRPLLTPRVSRCRMAALDLPLQVVRLLSVNPPKRYHFRFGRLTYQSAIGPKQRLKDVCFSAAIRGYADIRRTSQK